MMHLKAFLRLSGKIQVYTQYEFKDYIKALPAAHWNRKAACWEFPGTVRAAMNLAQLTAELRRQGMTIDTEANTGFSELLRAAGRQDAAQTIKSHVCTAKCPDWHFQEQAVRFARELPAAVLDMPTGTGKTVVAVRLIDNRAAKFTVVLTAKKAIGVWPYMLQQFGTGLYNCAALDLGSSEKNLACALRAVEASKQNLCPVVLIINYESAWRGVFAEWLEKQEIDFLIMDESHKIKSPSSTASRWCAKMRLKVKYALAMSATFWGDKLVDVYAQMRAIDPALLGINFQNFKRDYCICIGEFNQIVVGYRNQDRLAELLKPYLFRVDKSVLKLIPVRFKVYSCDFEPAARRIYDQFQDEQFAELQDGAEMSADNILTVTMRLQQLTGGIFAGDERLIQRFDESKAVLLRESIMELCEAGEIDTETPLICYCKFSADIAIVRNIAQGMGYVTGEISGACDDQEKFKRGEINFLAIQIRAGGAGIDGLQLRTHVAFYYSTGHSLIDYDQSLGRLDRPGQSKSVLNVFLCVNNTIDGTVIEALKDKQNVVDKIRAKITGEVGRVIV